MKPTNQQILDALTYLNSDNSKNIVKKKKDKDGNETDERYIPNAYNGYIAALGGTMVQMGLLPTVMVYHNHNKGNTQRKHITDALFALYKIGKDGIAENNFFDYLTNNWDENMMKTWRKEIMQIAIALKMGIRSFELIDENNNDD